MKNENHIALISDTPAVNLWQLSNAAAAIGRQIQRDFAPIWGITGTVDAFGADADIPHGYIRVRIKAHLADAPDLEGYHTDVHHQPYALVAYTKDWTVTVSHEVLELLGDPFGNTLVSATVKDKRVSILKELCDPCEGVTYDINGVQVSDFLLPEWYGDNNNISRTSFRSLRGVREVWRGGYYSYLDPLLGTWHQVTFFRGEVPVDTVLKGRGNSLREWTDAQAREHKRKVHDELHRAR
jgi:hypothetical protein